MMRYCMSKPKLLDICCGGGGAGQGYIDAGFEVTGIDILPQPQYPGQFVLADALTFDLCGYDAFHASPPCQRYSLATHFHGTQDNHPDLVDALRVRLLATGKPWIIENVVGAPLAKHDVLCGAMF